MVDTRTRRHARTRQAILKAASEIVRQQGPAALSMRALADRIDYSAAGIYEYFANKEEIIGEVCHEGFDRLAAYMRRSDPALPVADYLLAIGLAYIRFAVENPDYFVLMFSSGPIPTAPDPCPPGEEPQLPSSFGILVQTIQRGLEEGVFHARPGFGLMEMVYASWATVHGIAMLRAAGLSDYPVDLEQADVAVLRNLSRGLQAT
jgi:AcrR family transcriptional regulator